MDAIKEGMQASAKAAEASARLGERLFGQNAPSVMDFSSKVCTTIEQSERLLSLGLKKETADMVHYFSRSLAQDWTIVPLADNETARHIQDNEIPAWSLHRLIEMMPLDVVPDGGYDNVFTLIKNYPKGYSVEYDGFSYYHKENIYDTLIEGIEHLIKEGHFEKDYLV